MSQVLGVVNLSLLNSKCILNYHLAVLLTFRDLVQSSNYAIDASDSEHWSYDKFVHENKMPESQPNYTKSIRED